MDTEELGQCVRHRRTEKGWGQEHLAFVSGVSINTISRIERGYNASTVTLDIVLKPLGLTLDLQDLEHESQRN